MNGPFIEPLCSKRKDIKDRPTMKRLLYLDVYKRQLYGLCGPRMDYYSLWRMFHIDLFLR